jgi:hypothetical protein
MWDTHGLLELIVQYITKEEGHMAMTIFGIIRTLVYTLCIWIPNWCCFRGWQWRRRNQ